MQPDHAPEPFQHHDSAADSGQLEGSAASKKPFVEPTLSQAVSLPEVTGGFPGPISDI